MPHLVALRGFGAFESRALRFSLEASRGSRFRSYQVVDSLAEADCAVANADSRSAVDEIVAAGRVAHSFFVGVAAPDGAAAHLRRPIDPTRILQVLDRLVDERAADRSHRPVEPSALATQALHDFLVAVPQPGAAPGVAETPTTSAPAPAAGGAEAGSATDENTRSAAAKAAARVAARRRRQASATPAPVSGEPLRDVLVLEADPAASASLCRVLEGFGFATRVVGSIEQARARAERQVFAAAFLSVPFDAETIDLLEVIRAARHEDGPAPTAVVMVGARIDPASRVRIALAGIGEPLVKPLVRGDVARALDRQGVVFPVDARRRPADLP